MATANFIPEIWSKKLLKIFDKTVVMANLVNKDFEGEINNAGDVVHVRTFGDVTVNNYTRDMTISFQNLTDPMVDLLIDQQKYFAFKVDDLDKAQANVGILEGYAGRAAIAIRDVVDSRLIGHYTDVDAGNVIGTDVAPIALTSANIYSYITQLAEKLDNNNIPQESRHLVITPKFKTMLLQSDEFTRATSLGDNVIQNGYIGNVAGFGVHVTTNNPAVGSVVNLLAFTNDFISFASQVSKIENVRPYNMFADAVKGLYLYGSKVMLPKAGAVLKASNA
ncbi:P22 phage major capsid protein family protein [Vampirovibrio sp.]|uniref:P22 phage major capsid protein family protein n=1 Tax=Vampirovibrio sp. TaxID=2717857 RepID=UPI003593F55A